MVLVILRLPPIPSPQIDPPKIQNLRTGLVRELTPYPPFPHDHLTSFHLHPKWKPRTSLSNAYPRPLSCGGQSTRL